MSKTTENYGFTKPEVGEFFSLETWNGNMDKIDKELKKREDAQKESDNSLMNPDFTEAKERKNLTSGEKIHLMLGKISKFFSDMKAIAFSGSYNDLVDKPKIPTVLNNQTTTEEGFALDARQANPNIDGTLAKQVADLNGSLNSKKVPTIGIENIFTGNPFAVIADGGGLATVGGTKWEQDNGGYHVEDIKYPAGGSVSLTVSMTLPANSIVLIDVNTLNYENIKLQGTCIKYNLTSSPSNTSLSIFFSGRNANVTVSTIRYMPLVIHLV